MSTGLFCLFQDPLHAGDPWFVHGCHMRPGGSLHGGIVAATEAKPGSPQGCITSVGTEILLYFELTTEQQQHIIRRYIQSKF